MKLSRRFALVRVLARQIVIVLMCCGFTAAPASANSCDGGNAEPVGDPASLEASASAGNTAAQVVVGKRYLYGEGGGRNEASGVAWLTKAADAGDREGQYLLAEYYKDHGKSDDNLQKAVKLYRRAADQGCAAAFLYLGALTSAGKGGVAKDEKKGFELIAKSAALGYLPAQVMTGALLITGQGTKQDAKAGFAWVKRAADSGDSVANIALATLLMEGKGTRPDFELARTTLESVYAKRDSHAADAAYHLGWMYMEGKGVPPSDTDALRWMIVAANSRVGDSEQRFEILRDRVPKVQITKTCSVYMDPRLAARERTQVKVGETVIVLARSAEATEVYVPAQSLVGYLQHECVASRK